METINVPAYIATIIIFSLLMTFYIEWKYANRTIFRIHTYITIFCQYFCTFCFILLVPLDITVTLDGRRSEENLKYYNKNYNVIFSMYVTIYWIITILSNVMLVVQEQYNSNGFFTIFSRLKNSLYQLSLQLTAGIVFCAIMFGILLGTNVILPNFYGVFLTSILITNTLWMTFLMLILGYGLLMYPIDFWNRGNHEKRLNKIQYEIAKEFENVTHAYSDIFACISNIKQTEREINLDIKRYQHLLKPLEILKHDFPIEIDLNTCFGNVIINKQTNDVTIGSLANFREKLYWSNCVFTTSQSRLNSLQIKATYLEDIIDSQSDIAEIDQQIEGYKHINWSFKQKSTYVEYLWYTSIKPILYKLVGLIFALLSICSYFCIISTIKHIPQNISPYFNILNMKNITSHTITFFSFVTIAYMFFVVKWALFEMRFFKSLIFVKNRSTWTIPMSVNSRIFGSLVCPFIFVYLGWLHENGIDNSDNIPQTVFSNFYQMKEIPFLGNSSNAFFPILLLVVSILTSLNLLNKCLVSIRCSGFQFGVIDVTNASLENGKEKMAKRKKLVKRAYKNSLQQLNDNMEKSKKKEGLIDFVAGFQKQSKFHSNGSFINNEDCDEKKENLNYSSLTITQDQLGPFQKQYSLKDIGKKMESISEIFTEYGIRAPIDNENV